MVERSYGFGESVVFGLGTGGLDVGALRPESAADSDCLIFDHPDVMATVQSLAEQIVAEIRDGNVVSLGNRLLDIIQDMLVGHTLTHPSR